MRTRGVSLPTINGSNARELPSTNAASNFASNASSGRLQLRASTSTAPPGRRTATQGTRLKQFTKPWSGNSKNSGMGSMMTTKSWRMTCAASLRQWPRRFRRPWPRWQPSELLRRAPALPQPAPEHQQRQPYSHPPRDCRPCAACRLPCGRCWADVGANCREATCNRSTCYAAEACEDDQCRHRQRHQESNNSG